ncbi:protein AAR2 homolog [Anneissia japonica]|uniref:protein AAR2 homolog n=1 Tax=Anneissia japonica TaxID=1529436 RepID=UPI001425A6A0|nr:protein AAR2 homolog [Anneissia japonica]XP_033096749.1 protein AAR2 homolog [Anneissia japonica]
MATQSEEMDHETALRLFEEGGTLVFLNVPVGTEFGIDYNIWNVGEKFKGVKMIPPGMHFVHYSATSSYGIAPRTGFFHYFKGKEVVVKKWDKLNEEMSSEVASSEEVDRIRMDLRNLDKNLAPYPYSSLKKWVSLTNYISEDVAAKLQPASGLIASASQLVSDDPTRTTKDRASLRSKQQNINDAGPSQENLPNMHCKPGTEINFSCIPKDTHPPNATPDKITKYGMDSSYRLETFVSSNYKGHINGILAEIQFVFICFIVGHVYDAFEQWKNLVHLMCTSEEAMSNQEQLFENFISLLHFQLKEIPSDFFVDIVSRSNFLTITLQRLFSNIEEGSNMSTMLKQKAKKFKANLTKKFKWDFDLEPDDEAPVVVEL